MNNNIVKQLRRPASEGSRVVRSRCVLHIENRTAEDMSFRGNSLVSASHEAFRHHCVRFGAPHVHMPRQRELWVRAAETFLLEPDCSAGPSTPQNAEPSSEAITIPSDSRTDVLICQTGAFVVLGRMHVTRSQGALETAAKPSEDTCKGSIETTDGHRKAGAHSVAICGGETRQPRLAPRILLSRDDPGP